MYSWPVRGWVRDIETFTSFCAAVSVAIVFSLADEFGIGRSHFTWRVLRPVFFKAKDFLRRWQWRLRLNPTHRLCADVGEAVQTADASPDHVARAEVVNLTVCCGAGMATDEKVGFFKSMIVQID